MQIHDLTRQNPATGSQLVFDTGSATYKALVSDVAKVIMEQYTGTTLAGSAQTPKAAIDTLNGNLNNRTDAFARFAPFSSINVGSGKKLVFSLTTSGATSYRGAILLFGHTNADVTPSPQVVFYSWANNGTTISVNHIVGTSTIFDNPVLNRSVLTNVRIEIPVPNYSTLMAFGVVNANAASFSLENAS